MEEIISSINAEINEESVRFTEQVMGQALRQWKIDRKEVEEKMKLSIKSFVDEVHKNALTHGWWDGEERTFGELIALCHSELSEALEEYRKGKAPTETYYRKDGKPEGIPSELADVIIRIFDMCGHYGIDIEAMLKEKHEFNKTRPYKHGDKVI